MSRRRARRLARTVAVAVAAVVLVWWLASALAPGPPSPPSAAARLHLMPAAHTVYVVQPGDTLWHIARRLQPAGDIRPLVDQLADAHGPGPLMAGERLPLP